MNLFLALLSLLTWMITGLVKICSIFMSQKRKYYVFSNLRVGNEEMPIGFSALSLSSCVKFCGNLCFGLHLSKQGFRHLAI